MPANTKPGKSTHPYDTGVGNTTATSSRDSRQSTPASHRIRRADISVGQTPQAPDQLRKNKRVNSVSSIRNKIPTPTPQKIGMVTGTPESRTIHIPSNKHRIKLRGILGLRTDKKDMPNTSSPEGMSTSPGQSSEKSEPQVEETGPEFWRSFKRRTRVFNGDRNTISGIAKRLQDEEDEDNQGVASNSHARNTGVNARESGYLRDKIMKKSPENTSRYEYKNRELSMRQERSVDRVQKPYIGTEKTEKDGLSPQTNTELAKIPGQSRRHRRSKSSSQAHASTAGTSSTPGNVAAHKDTTREESRHQTPSPMVPTQVLRLLLGPGKSPSPKTGTQQDQEGTEIGTSASMVILGRPSRDDQASDRQSIEQKNRAWVPFWGSPRSPRPQAGLSRHDDANEASRQKYIPEPNTGDQGQNVGAGQKRVLGRVSRRRWRSG
ncbi:hypothetical protein K445DRAFT_376957 [Daldinia sp. EC12]|nr:hypothetical protein K445DRAFT_376957 [Daldinia sp. EC12]